MIELSLFDAIIISIFFFLDGLFIIFLGVLFLDWIINHSDN